MSRRSFAPLTALVLAAVSAASLVAQPAEAIVVERVVAVVGDRPILLSELRHRAKPNLLRIMSQQGRDANFQAAAETETFKEILNRMIDDRLEEQAAEKSRIAVTPEEVDKSIANVATRGGTTVANVIAEVRRSGLTEQDFRDEMRRQILEGKLLELRVRPRVRITEQDAREAYKHYTREVGEQQVVDLRVIALRVPQGATEEQTKARENMAGEITARARKGEDFCKLVTEFTEDTETKATCGSRGPQPLQYLLPGIRDSLRGMKPGDVSEPIHIRYGADAIVVFQLQNQPKMQPYEEVRAEMMQRALLEGLEHQRKLWLQELRRGVYIDVRL